MVTFEEFNEQKQEIYKTAAEMCRLMKEINIPQEAIDSIYHDIVKVTTEHTL